MRRYWREPQATRTFRGSELPRLISGVTMLVLLVLLYGWMRDANHWRWAAGEDGEKSAAQGPDLQGQPAAPAATGPTDEDPEQAAEARQEFLALTDGTLRLGPEEMEAYDRLVEWVKNQPFARLESRAKKGLRYTHLYDDAEKHRGEMVALDMEIRMADDAGVNRYGVPLCEAWGTTDESRGRLYALIVLDYPKGMPSGSRICEKAKFVGYFLKLQGYEPASATPGQAPERAPLLIGRLQWKPAVVPKTDASQEWIWGLGAMAAIGLVLVVRLAYRKWFLKKPAPRPMVSAATGEVVPIDVWLEQSQFGDENEERGIRESRDG